MSYPYPKYNDEVLVHTFLTIWHTNHVSQQWLKVDVDNKSTIVIPTKLNDYCFTRTEKGLNLRPSA